MSVSPEVSSSSIRGKPFVGLIALMSHVRVCQNAYLWLLLGILFRLPHIKVSAELEAAQLAGAKPRRRWIL